MEEQDLLTQAIEQVQKNLEIVMLIILSHHIQQPEFILSKFYKRFVMGYSDGFTVKSEIYDSEYKQWLFRIIDVKSEDGYCLKSIVNKEYNDKELMLKIKSQIK